MVLNFTGLVEAESADSLSAEQRFVVSYLRRGLGQTRAIRAESPLDWQAVANFALREGVAPLLYVGLTGSEVSPPNQLLDVLRAEYALTQLWRRAWLWPTFATVLGSLQAAGLEPIVLKGPALAYTAYPEPTLRTFSDLDLLFRPEQLASASQLLQAHGFSVDASPLPDGHHHLPLHRSADGRVVVELHHHILPERNPYRVELELLYSRSRVVEIAGITARALGPVDALFHACLHLSFSHRYRFYPLRNLIDILVLTTRRSEALDWDLLVRTTRDARAEGAVYWPLLISQLWLEAQIPEWVLAALAPPALVRRLVGEVADSRHLLDNLAPPERGSAVLYQLLLNFSLYSGCPPATQVGALWRGLFPRPEDIDHLPDQVTGSPVRYAAYLANAGRVGRGFSALYRLWRHPASGRAGHPQQRSQEIVADGHD